MVAGIAMACVEPESATNRHCSGLFDSEACARFKGPSAGTLPQLTIDMCEAACTGFTYVGLNNGDRCYCGSEIVISPTAFANATNDKCSSPCPGNKAQNCGGHAIDGSGRFTSVYVRSGSEVLIRVQDGVSSASAERREQVLTAADRPPPPNSLPTVPTVTARTGFKLATNRMSRQRFQAHSEAIPDSHVKPGKPTIVAICRSHPCRDAPAELDWERRGGVVTPVKDQGMSCNASWAFAAVAAIESASALATGRLFSLSEQELLDCGWYFGLQSCRGGSIDRAFRYVASTGLSTQDTYSYSGTANRCCGSSQGYTGVPSQEGQGMQAFCDLPPMNESELVGALQFQPVAVGMAIDQEFMNYKGGILRSKVGSKDGRPLNHAALIVGYTPNYWRIKNSFGAAWGEDGYARIARGVGGAGQYAILTAPSYPSVISPKKIYPAPVKPHNYDKPPCKPHEVELAVAGLSSPICTHTCSPTQKCPGHSGKGSDAVIECAFEDPKTGKHYCAVICENDCDCAQAPVALTCQKSPALAFSICLAPPAFF